MSEQEVIQVILQVNAIARDLNSALIAHFVLICIVIIIQIVILYVVLRDKEKP